jgi:hypothetical protein
MAFLIWRSNEAQQAGGEFVQGRGLVTPAKLVFWPAVSRVGRWGDIQSRVRLDSADPRTSDSQNEAGGSGGAFRPVLARYQPDLPQFR